MEEEEASPNKSERAGAGRGRNRVFGAWVVSHPVTRHGSTAGARAAILPLVRRQRDDAAARRRRDEAVVGLAVEVAARRTFFRALCSVNAWTLFGKAGELTTVQAPGSEGNYTPFLRRP